MRIKLSVLNRLSLLGLLTNKGDSTTLKILRELREELSFTEEDHKVLQFQPMPGGKAKWNELPLKEVEFKKGSIREGLLEEVKTQLKDLEKKKTLELDYLELWETLIEGKKPKVEPELKAEPEPELDKSESERPEPELDEVTVKKKFLAET